MKFKHILNYIFPSTCVLCGKLEKNYLCKKCEKRIEKYSKFSFIEKDSEMIFDRLFYCYYYEKIIRNLLLDYKFRGKSYISNFFARMLLNCEKTYRFFSIYDIIIPVPMEKQKKLKRGYNQTELITDIISQNTNIYNGKDEIIKFRETKRQSSLSVKERKENIKDAFIIKNQNTIYNKRVILFDDIFTTGATVNEISKVLKEAGAKEVLVLVLAKDQLVEEKWKI